MTREEIKEMRDKIYAYVESVFPEFNEKTRKYNIPVPVVTATYQLAMAILGQLKTLEVSIDTINGCLRDAEAPPIDFVQELLNKTRTGDGGGTPSA